MKKLARRNLTVLVLSTALMAPAVMLVVYAPTLYRTFCALTGIGGTVRRASQTETHAINDRKVTVFFDANVATGLPWTFKPDQRKVVVRLNESTRVSYFARNDSNETVVARATFNITPYKAAPYFYKIECFCFTEERLEPGESAHMPIVFYIDDEMLKDRNNDDVTQITLSYTMFRQTGLTPEQVKAVRDLSAGSKAEETTLKRDVPVEFNNDARRR